MQINYRGRNQAESTQRRFDPYALVHRWGWWYAVGYCHLRTAQRTFRVDRILALTLLDQTFSEPADFDVQTYLASNWQAQPTVHVRLHFAPEFARVALDDDGHWDSVEEYDNGSVVVSFSAPDMEWAAGTVLSYGGSAIVLEPESLRLLVRDRALDIAKQHNSDDLM